MAVTVKQGSNERVEREKFVVCTVMLEVAIFKTRDSFGPYKSYKYSRNLTFRHFLQLASLLCSPIGGFIHSNSHNNFDHE